jgi:threonine aldolase
MVIDLRSDTVTKPTPEMREAMARAEVGDDVYGEDPTVRALEEKVAHLLGKEASLFVPSGTMANQIALAVHTKPGDEVLIGEGAHCEAFESGAGAALAGVQFHAIGDGGLFTGEDVDEAVHPDNHHYAPTTLCSVENTHNRSGGRCFSLSACEDIAAIARKHGLRLHLDGARLLNAAVALGRSARALAAPFDSVSLCLSKGLGAPVGSLVAGSKDFVHRAHRRRKMMGGGMRQAGILAAAGLWALEHHVERLVEDHHNARRFAEGILGAPGIDVELATVETNIVIWELKGDVPFDAAEYVARARAQGLLLNSISARRLRAVTHLDVDAAACARAAEIAVEIMKAQ